MKYSVKERRFPSATGNGFIRYRLWVPEDPCAAVQLTHGMAEHIDRYDAFATYLAEQGILVYGQDHAGHGKSTPEQPRGYFSEEHGWDHLVADMELLYQTVSADYPAIPYVLFGHSMGSFLARSYAARHPRDFDAYVFMGTAGPNPLLPFGRLLIRAAIALKGTKTVSLLLNNLATGSYNQYVARQQGAVRTPFDWISSVDSVVDRYIADPLCGFPFTNGGLRDLLDGLTEISSSKWARKLADKPIFLLSGMRDPVGGKNASGVMTIYGRLKAAGRMVEMKLYPDVRHELLNETIADDVYGDIYLFLNMVEAMGERR